MFKTMRLGRKPTPVQRLATVPLIADHLNLAQALPLIADSVAYEKRVTENWGMLGNDAYGDCVFASRAHFAQCASKNATGKMRIITTEQVLRWYSECTGFNRNDPNTDNGAVPLDALKYFMRIGEILAYGRVDPKNDAHVAATIELFGGLYSGWDLPLAWQSTTDWDAGPSVTGKWEPGSWGGHMVSQTGFDDKCNTPTVTWGELINVTAAARHVYCSEAYAIITPEWFDTYGQTLQGFDLTALKSALNNVV